MRLDDAGDAGPRSGTDGSGSTHGRFLRYLLLGVLTALTAGGLASWIRSRSKTEHWQSAPTGWNAHTHPPVAELVDVSEPVEPGPLDVTDPVDVTEPVVVTESEDDEAQR